MTKVRKPSSKEISELTVRGVAMIIPSTESFKRALLSDKRLTFYLGVDPTAPALHLGNSIQLLFLRRVQDLGHRIIFLIGDFTARIGDPSDKLAVRTPLSSKEIIKNLKGYRQQAAKIISFSKPNPAQIVFNSSWWDKMTFAEVLKLAERLTIQQLLGRDMFQKRLKDGKPIFLHEFLYPMLQGYDSVVLGVNGEVGGQDQLFNMLVGRDLLKALKRKEKLVVGLKLLEDPTTGKKMSKSEGNAIWLNDVPSNMYGKVMSLPDELVFPCFELCTAVAQGEIEEMKKASKSGEALRDIKSRLAFILVEMYHGKAGAEEAGREFKRVFRQKELPQKMPTLTLSSQDLTLSSLLVKNKLTQSRSEAERLIKQGGVKIDGETIKDWKATFPPDARVLQLGKRRFFCLRRA